MMIGDYHRTYSSHVLQSDRRTDTEDYHRTQYGVSDGVTQCELVAASVAQQPLELSSRKPISNCEDYGKSRVRRILSNDRTQ